MWNHTGTKQVPCASVDMEWRATRGDSWQDPYAILLREKIKEELS